MLDSLKVLWDIFNDKKKNLVSKNINWAYTNDQVNKVLSWEVLNPKEYKDKPKDNTAINLSTKKLLDIQGINIEDLVWKKILDIWWGFTGLPFLMNWLEADIDIVDPVFLNNLSIEISRNKQKIMWLIPEFDEKNYKAYKNWETKKQEYLYNLNFEFNNILSDIRGWEQYYRWKNFSIWDTKVNVYPNTWEEIDFINIESKDIIFINHTITKNQVDPHTLLNKAYELLKKWWKIYITESGKLDYWLFKMWNEEFNIEVIDSYYLNEKTILILEKK